MSVALRARQPPTKPHHGQFIYLYSHLKTNQVIYSLRRDILAPKQEKALLKQLTFYGKKTVPTKLRRDFWKPFAVVTFPKPEDGLQVYKTLREYRLVRDHSWTFKPTEADLEVASEQANKDKFKELSEGIEGEKENEDDVDPTNLPTAYDKVLTHYTRWPNKKERAKLLMDQRATSVADLADIISKVSNTTAGAAKAFRARREQDKFWKKIETLAEIPQETIDKMETQKTAFQTERRGKTAGSQQSLKEKTKARARERHVSRITMELNRIRKAREALAFVAGEDVPEDARKKWPGPLQKLVQSRTTRPVNPDFLARKAQRDAAAAADATPEASSEEGEAAAPPPPHKSTPRNTRFSKQNRIAGTHKPELDARPTLDLPSDAVLIQWTELSHAQFARSWHENVYHDVLADDYAAKALRVLARAEAAEAAAQEPEQPEWAVGAEGVEDYAAWAREARREREEEERRTEGSRKGAVGRVVDMFGLGRLVGRKGAATSEEARA